MLTFGNQPGRVRWVQEVGATENGTVAPCAPSGPAGVIRPLPPAGPPRIARFERKPGVDVVWSSPEKTPVSGAETSPVGNGTGCWYALIVPGRWPVGSLL